MSSATLILSLWWQSLLYIPHRSFGYKTNKQKQTGKRTRKGQKAWVLKWSLKGKINEVLCYTHTRDCVSSVSYSSKHPWGINANETLKFHDKETSSILFVDGGLTLRAYKDFLLSARQTRVQSTLDPQASACRVSTSNSSHLTLSLLWKPQTKSIGRENLGNGISGHIRAEQDFRDLFYK